MEQIRITWEKYVKEFMFLKLYIAIIILIIGLSYSVLFIFDVETVVWLGAEDHLFEWATFAFLFFSFSFCLTLFYKKRNVFFGVLSIIFIFGAGEEISWGQRIFNIKPPEFIERDNVQHELSIHNLEIFNGSDFAKNRKDGLNRLLEMNFLFRIFMISFGIITPFFVYHIKLIKNSAKKLKLPVPPISMGIFFFINWFIFFILHAFLFNSKHEKHSYTAGEIFECLGAFIFFMTFIYFYLNRNRIPLGMDIKEQL